MKKLKYFEDLEKNPLLHKMVYDKYQKLGVIDGQSVLDIGCGNAYFGRYLPSGLRHIRLFGIDIDNIAKTGTKYNYSRIYIQDIDSKPHLAMFRNNSLDYIIAKDFLEHLQKPWKLIPDLFRVLKPGGKIYAHVPNYTSSMAWIDYTHVRPFCKTSLRLLFEDYGFQVEQLNYDMFWIFTDKFFAKTFVNLPLVWRLAGGIEIIARKPKL